MLLATLLVVVAPAAVGAAPAWPGLVSRPVGGSLADAIGQARAGWVGWAVPGLPGQYLCCSWDQRACRLDASGFSTRDDRDGGEVRVLVKMEAGRVRRIRALSASCDVDPDGARVTWLEGVPAAESVRWLSAVPGSEDGLGALAFHAEPAAIDALIRVARRDPDGERRGQALFWLAQRAGEKATATLAEAVEEDPETEVKTQAVFALSQLPRDEAVPALLRVAQGHRNARVRERAMFWLGQTGDPRALDFFEKVLTRQ